MNTNTERIVPRNTSIEIPPFKEIESEDLEVIEKFIECDRLIQEIRQLFGVLRYTITAFHRDYRIKPNGTAFCRWTNSSTEEEDYYAINGLVIAILGAWKSLLEAMNVYNREFPCSAAIKSWKDTVSTVYDNSFNYRFLLRLRDYSQHGHVPVSVVEGKFCFDLYQISEKPHYSHNAAVKQEMEQYIDEILDVYKDSPELSLIGTLYSFLVEAGGLYLTFWDYVGATMPEIHAAFLATIERYPENRHGETFIYKPDAQHRTLHFAILGDSMHYLKEAIEEANGFCKKMGNYQSRIKLVVLNNSN